MMPCRIRVWCVLGGGHDGPCLTQVERDHPAAIVGAEMSDIKRYDKVDQHPDDGGGASMEESPDGDWVKYEDYAFDMQLAQERENSEGNLAELRLAEINQLRSKLDAIMSAIRHCAGESSFDNWNAHGDPDGYCSECGRGTKAGHEALCWRRFAFEETPR